MAPIMLLEGHQGDVFSLEFHPEGQYLASTGFDRQICIYIELYIKYIYIIIYFNEYTNMFFISIQLFGMSMGNVKISLQ